MARTTLSYSVADQSFRHGKSLGVPHLALQLGNALAHSGRFDSLTFLANSELADSLPAGFPTRSCDWAAGRRASRILWDQWGCYETAQRTRNTWLLLPKGFASFLRRPPMRLAAYVHDAVHSFYASKHPRALPRLELHYFQRSLRATLQTADVVFTNTEFTRSEVLRLAREWDIPAPRTLVAGIGFTPPPDPAPQKEDQLVVLVSPYPHKRSTQALSWIARWQQQSGYTGRVHVVGSLPPDAAPPSDAGWQLHTRLSTLQFHHLLRSSRALFYFSEYEGFGMPPVEAVLAGACPVFSSTKATCEVMQECGRSFSNDDFQGFCTATESALQTPVAELRTWADQLLLRHNWTRTTATVADALAAVPR